MANVLCIARIFAAPYRAMAAGDLTQAKYVFSAVSAARRAKKTQPGFSLGKHKKTFGPVGAGEMRSFTEVNVTRNSTMFLVSTTLGRRHLLG
jgi:hypothetical protein